MFCGWRPYRTKLPLKILNSKQELPVLRLLWPSAEWETGAAQNFGKNGKEIGKWPRPEFFFRKMAAKMGKTAQKMAKLPIFPFRWPFFGHFRPGTISHFLSHFPRIRGAGQWKGMGEGPWHTSLVPLASPCFALCWQGNRRACRPSGEGRVENWCKNVTKLPPPPKMLSSRLSGGATEPSQPDLPLWTRATSEPLPPDLIRTRSWPGFDPIRTRKDGFQVRTGSKSGPNQVQGEGFRGGTGPEGQVRLGRLCSSSGKSWC